MRTSILNIVLLLILALSPLSAYNYSWSSHEDPIATEDDDETGECEGSECEGQPDPCGGRTGSPVYLKTGHFTWEEKDIVLAGTPSIALKRNYTSHEPRSGLFGNGWISNMERALVKTRKIIPVNVVYSSSSGGGVAAMPYTPPVYVNYYIFRHPNGLRYTFKIDENGTLKTPRGLFESVEMINSDSYAFNYPDGSKEVYSDGNLVTRQDKNGNTITLEYDNNALLQKVRDDNGRNLNFYYNAQGYVSDVADHTGRTWHYEYDTSGNLVGVTNPLGGTRNFEYTDYKPQYDAQHYSQITKIIDESGRVVTSVTYSAQRVATYTEGANTFTYSYDFGVRTATKVDSTGSIYGFAWDPSGIITQKTDPLGNTVTSLLDENLTSIGRIDQAGNTWSRTVDSLGRTLTKTSPMGQTVSYTYEGDNPSPSTITSALGHVTTLTYDTKGNVKTITDAEGHTRNFKYDTKGNITEIADAKGNKTTIAYNANNQPTSITNTLGYTTTIAYDALGRQQSITDAEGRTTIYEYNTVGSMVTTTDAIGNVVEYTYDIAGHLTTLKDPVGNTTTYTYDNYGRVSTETRPDGGVTRYTYNTDNTIKTITRRDGKTVSYSYDATKRPTSQSVDGDIISYTYDAEGNILSATNSSGTVSFAYDETGKLIKETQLGIDITTSYDADSNVKTLSFLNKTVNYSRDALGLATNIDTTAFSYDANSIQTQLDYANGTSEANTFDAVYNIKKIQTANETLDYTQDKTGLITSKNSTNYTYDNIGRLTQAGADSFSYDATGNNQNDNAIYNILNNRLSASDIYTITYDSMGNIKSKHNKLTNTTSNYTFNSRNQLVSYAQLDDANQTTKTLTYTYDAFNRRVSKTEDGIEQKYLYDGDDIVAILDSNKVVIATITHDESIDTPLSITNTNGTFYYHRDHQGSIVALTDSAGTVVESFTYDNHYGTIVNHTKTTETNNPYAYTGRELDTDELYYYRARYYDPSLERFLGEDPIGFGSGDFNWYRYVGNSPVNLVDPNGLQPYGDPFITYTPPVIPFTSTTRQPVSPAVRQAQQTQMQAFMLGLSIAGIFVDAPLGFGIWAFSSAVCWDSDRPGASAANTVASFPAVPGSKAISVAQGLGFSL